MENEVLKGAIALVVGFVVGLTTKFISDRLSAEKELRQLIAELKDIQRHCRANLKVIKGIELQLGIPSAMHFEKMKIPETSILFSPETFRKIQVDYAELLYRLRLNVRNINIELTELNKYAATDACSADLLGQYIAYSRDKQDKIVKRIDRWKGALSTKITSGLEAGDEGISVEALSGDTPSYSMPIIYDRPFPSAAPKALPALPEQVNAKANEISQADLLTEPLLPQPN